MLRLRPSTVPPYLRDSQLYQSYSYCDEEFEVPADKFKADLSIKSVADLSLLLNTFDHWRPNECMVEVIDYLYNQLSKADLKKVCNEFGNVWNLRYINLLQDIRFNDMHPVNLPLREGYASIAIYMRNSGFFMDEHSLACALASLHIECVRFVLQEIQIFILGLPPVESLPPAENFAVFVKRFTSIRPSSVPSYLHSSALYKSLDIVSDDEFDVPILHYKLDLTIDSHADLVLLFDTLDYWGSDEIFPEVLLFMYPHYKLARTLKGLPTYLYQNYVHRWKYMPILWKIVERKNQSDHMSIALQSGIVELVAFLREQQGIPLDDMSMQYAIRSGNPDCIRYVNDNKQFILPAPTEGELFFPRRLNFTAAQPSDINTIKRCIAERLTDVMTAEYCMIAAKAGDLEVLQQLHTLRCPWDVTSCTEAAAHGHLPCLTFAHEQGAPWDAGTCAAAAKNKHMDCLTYLVENGCPADGAVSRAAIANCDLEMLTFAHENLLPWEDDMCMLAALAGSLPCLKYLHEAGCDLTSETCAAAATRHSLECLIYAHENGAPWTVSTPVAAVRRYNQPALEYAHKNGCPVDKQVCAVAIKVNCNLRMLWYMGDNKFPMDANLCRQAAKQGSDNLLTFLHWHECPWTVATTRDAAAAGKLESLKYAAEHGCPVAPITCSYHAYCSENSPHFECMKYIYDNHNKTFDSVCAITRDHFACFCYAHDNGAPWSENIVVTAARLGKLDYLAYAFEEGDCPCPFYKYFPSAYDAAVENEHEECVEYLDELRDARIHTIKRVFQQRRRQRRENGWMVIRKVLVNNWCTRHQITYDYRLAANRWVVSSE